MSAARFAGRLTTTQVRVCRRRDAPVPQEQIGGAPTPPRRSLRHHVVSKREAREGRGAIRRSIVFFLSLLREVRKVARLGQTLAM